MTFAEFYGESTGWNGTDFSGPVKLIPMCGSDAVYKLDARKSLPNQIQDAKKRAESLKAVKPGIKGFKVLESPSWRFSEGKPVTDLIPL